MLIQEPAYLSPSKHISHSRKRSFLVTTDGASGTMVIEPHLFDQRQYHQQSQLIQHFTPMNNIIEKVNEEEEEDNNDGIMKDV